MKFDRFCKWPFCLVILPIAAGAMQAPVAGELEPERHAAAASVTPILGLDKPSRFSLHAPRPRLNLALRPASFEARGEQSAPAFSWSLETWRINTASLAHIRCNRYSLTDDAYLAQDCHFVDQPTPEDAINLVQVRGQWTAAPGLSLGLGAFGSPDSSTNHLPRWASAPHSAVDPLDPYDLSAWRPVGGLDLNISFGIQTEQLGQFLVGLQLARYRQRPSFDFLNSSPVDPWASIGLEVQQVEQAQLNLGWQLGDFRGDLFGLYRQSPQRFAGEYLPAEFNSFDLEFSWNPRNASISIGVSNVLDAQPRPSALESAAGEDTADPIFGRIPYVRYKHDL